MLRGFWATTRQAEKESAGNEPAPAGSRAWFHRRRRGATALEYLVALSFIIVVVILAVQHLGKITSGIFGQAAEATTDKSDTGGSKGKSGGGKGGGKSGGGGDGGKGKGKDR